MDFTKIKRKDGAVLLEWTTTNGDDSRRTTLTSTDEPEPEFTDALQAMALHVCRLLDLPDEYAEGMTVSGVSISRNDHQGRGIVVTCLKTLGKTNAPLVINTPHLPEENEHGPEIPSDMLRALDELEARAVRYHNGHRMQADLIAA